MTKRKNVLGEIKMQVGAVPTDSDIVVANILARHGHDIEFLAPSRAYRVRTPDITMNGHKWEIKCPTSNKIDKLRQNMSSALGQSRYIIVGTFRTKITDEKIIRYAEKYVYENKKVKQLKIITKAQTIIDLK